MVACLVDIGRVKDVPGDHGARKASGAIAAVAIDAKEEFAEHHCLPALMANALYEDKYPLVARPSAARSSPRSWSRRRTSTAPPPSPTAAPARATTRCASTSACAPSTRASRSSPRPGGRLAEPRGAARLRRRARHPGHAHQEEPVLDRREPVGAQQRVRRARGPVGGAAGGRLPVRQVGRRRAGRAAARRGRASRRASRSRSTAWRWAWSSSSRRSTPSATRTASAGST